MYVHLQNNSLPQERIKSPHGSDPVAGVASTDQPSGRSRVPFGGCQCYQRLQTNIPSPPRPRRGTHSENPRCMMYTSQILLYRKHGTILLLSIAETYASSADDCELPSSSYSDGTPSSTNHHLTATVELFTVTNARAHSQRNGQAYRCENWPALPGLSSLICCTCPGHRTRTVQAIP
jgi:hypothetical protein